MSDPFLGEIRLFAGNFAPVGWALCDGSILPISQYTAVFSLLGTTYGGNGTSNFALPNLQGTVPIHWGQGAGLSSRTIGETGGATSVTLTPSEGASHTHPLLASTGMANTGSPAGSLVAVSDPTNPIYVGNPGAAAPLAFGPQAIGETGAAAPVAHNNMQPYLVVNFCIALQGVFPSRN